MAFIYLASPYSHPSELVRHTRYLQVSEVTAQLLCEGIPTYSPIVHCHELAIRHSLPKDFTFWEAYNFAMLGVASSLYILQLPDWETSKGLRGEIQFALQHRIPIQHLPYTLVESRNV